MECTIDWGGPNGMLFTASTGSGHVAVMDGAVDGGGHNLAPRPMEMLLAGTGGCTAYDVVLILKRGRHAVTGCSVKLQADRADVEMCIRDRARTGRRSGTNRPRCPRVPAG